MSLEPFFLDGPCGRLFALHHTPPEAIRCRGHILCVPPFNEEMNRCRSMMTQQAQSLAQSGFGTLVLDLYGTGESDGEHGDACWETWLGDIAAGVSWLEDQPGGCVALLGTRLGVPLAAEALGRLHGRRRGLIAWQPVSDGKSYFTQFLRIRIAANMDRSDIPRETTGELRQALADGKSVEVAGYEVNPRLASAIEAIRLPSLAPPANTPIAWFERSAGEGSEIAPASKVSIDEWRFRDLAVHDELFEGQAFWALHDRAEARDLIGQTTRWLAAQELAT